jgi:peroxiredoxin
MAVLLTSGLLLLGAAGCSKDPVAQVQQEPPAKLQPAALQQAPSTAVAAAPAKAEPAKTASGQAELGKTAPLFTLPDLNGKPVSLESFKGKTVVLEWFNPECPFVKLSHTKGSLVGLAEKHAKAGVVWLAINSGAPGKQGHGSVASQKGVEQFGMKHPVLIDEDGKVGQSYGAARTPHLFVINPAGQLVYHGAIDNSPDGELASAPGGQVVNYVDQALQDVASGAQVRVPTTQAYGCSVKYAQ